MLLSYLFHHTGVHLTTKPCVKALIIQYNLCFGEEMRDRDRHFKMDVCRVGGWKDPLSKKTLTLTQPSRMELIGVCLGLGTLQRKRTLSWRANSTWTPETVYPSLKDVHTACHSACEGFYVSFFIHFVSCLLCLWSMRLRAGLGFTWLACPSLQGPFTWAAFAPCIINAADYDWGHMLQLMENKGWTLNIWAK